MDKNERQLKILKLIKETNSPLSASKIGQMLGVSRQLVVGDIALLRASGYEIVATPRGYIMNSSQTKDNIYTIACIHLPSQMEEELNIIVDEGAEVIDVIVEHPVYGQLVGNLHLSSRRDVKNFVDLVNLSQAGMLSSLSNGIHLHTIKCKDDEVYLTILERLKEHHLLYEDEK